MPPANSPKRKRKPKTRFPATKRVRTKTTPKASGPGRPTHDNPLLPRGIRVDAVRWRSYRKAARFSGLTLNAWLLVHLDAAAGVVVLPPSRKSRKSKKNTKGREQGED